VSEEARLREELLDLDRRREHLDRKIEDAVRRQRYAPSPDEVDRAKSDERSVLSEMDRLMTRIRAVEGKLLQLRKHPRA
jgi:predicted  nucleic acid-binding Zn-ribbon protein